MRDQNKTHKAIRSYIRIKQLSIDTEQVINAYIELGYLFRMNRKLSLSSKHYHTAIKKSDGIDSLKAVYLKGIAYNGLGILYFDQRNSLEAEKFFLESLKYKESLFTKEKSNSNINEMAKTLLNLCGLYAYEYECSNGEKVGLKAVELYSQLLKEDSIKHLAFYSMSLSNLGSLYQRCNSFEKAKDYSLSAIDISQKLAKNNPEAYLSEFSRDQHGLAILYRKMGEKELAKKYYFESLKNHEILLRKNPDAFSIPYSRSLFGAAKFFYYNFILESLDEETYLNMFIPLLENAKKHLENYSDHPHSKSVLNSIQHWLTMYKELDNR